MFCFALVCFSLQPLSAVLGISIVRQGRFLKPILLFLDLLEQVTEKQFWERPSFQEFIPVFVSPWFIYSVYVCVYNEVRRELINFCSLSLPCGV